MASLAAPRPALSLCELFGAMFCELNGVSRGGKFYSQVQSGKIDPEVTPNSTQIFTPDNLQSERDFRRYLA